MGLMISTAAQSACSPATRLNAGALPRCRWGCLVAARPGCQTPARLVLVAVQHAVLSAAHPWNWLREELAPAGLATRPLHATEQNTENSVVSLPCLQACEGGPPARPLRRPPGHGVGLGRVRGVPGQHHAEPAAHLPAAGTRGRPAGRAATAAGPRRAAAAQAGGPAFLFCGVPTSGRLASPSSALLALQPACCYIGPAAWPGHIPLLLSCRLQAEADEGSGVSAFAAAVPAGQAPPAEQAAEGGGSAKALAGEIQLLRTRRTLRTLGLVQDLADLLMVLPDLRGGASKAGRLGATLSTPAVLALAGLVSGCLSAYKNWPGAAR